MVRKTYRAMHLNQTVDFVKRKVIVINMSYLDFRVERKKIRFYLPLIATIIPAIIVW